MTEPSSDARAEFQRFSAPDADALARNIAATRQRLAAALDADDALSVVDAAGDLGSQLTTARREGEAVELLEAHRLTADALDRHEPAGWFWCAYATALQYRGRRSEAQPSFLKAIELARAGGWRRLEALALHHWGRSLVEQGRHAEAQACFSQALFIREALGEASQASSRRALAELALLRSQAGGPDG